MSSQTTVALHDKSNTSLELQIKQKRGDNLLFLAVCGTTVFLTPLVVLAGINLGLGLLLAMVAVIGLTAVIARWPQAGFFAIAGCAVLIEVEPLTVPVLTDRLYVYYWPTVLQGLIERPIGFLFIFILLVIVCRHLFKREPLLRGGALIVPYLLFLLCVVGGAVYGYLTGGDTKVIVVELRPFLYLFESYLVAYNLISRKSHVRLFFWLVIVGAFVKALQGIYVYFIALHGNTSLLGTSSLLSHEESFFFVGLLLLVVLLSSYYRYKPQQYAALCALPFVVVALVLNNRRADYVAFIAALGVIWALIFIIRPRNRRALVIILLVSATLGTGYLLLFAASTSGFGAPARAIVSVFLPSATDTRDSNSNLYRTDENFDLQYTISHENPWVGLGFGKPYLQPIPLTSVFPQIGSVDIYYGYVPHNNIYWVWMRLGVIGFLAFWYLIGSIVVRGSLIACRLRDRYLQTVAIYAVSITVVEIFVAYADYQLYTYRNVIYVGLLAGMLMKLPELEKEEAGA